MIQFPKNPTVGQSHVTFSNKRFTFDGIRWVIEKSPVQSSSTVIVQQAAKVILPSALTSPGPQGTVLTSSGPFGTLEWKDPIYIEDPNLFKFTFTVILNCFNFNLRQKAIEHGWDTVKKLNAVITVIENVYIGSHTTDTASFSTGAGFPAGSQLSLINNGFILGRGGNGGYGPNVASMNTQVGAALSTGATSGGPALLVEYPIHIDNRNTIGGGGGGGAGCQSTYF
jgi:hypothetical protein